MQPKIRGILLVIIAALLSSAAQIMFKFASSKITFSLASFITNVPLIIGFFLYALVALFFILGLKEGELTVLYPILATTYIWTAIASPFFFPSDSLSPLKIIGIIIIITGVYSIARGMQHKVEVV